jgi:hypothetical protein
MVRVRRAGWRGVREEPACDGLLIRHRLEPGGYGPGATRTRWRGRWGTPATVPPCCRGGCEEGLRRTRSEVAGAKSGSSFIKRISVNTGTIPDLALARPCPAGGWGWAHRPSIGPGWGGAAVVLRAGESPCTWGRAAAVSRRDGCCNAGRCTAEWWRSSTNPCWAVGEGIGDAGQASSLGGGRSWPPVR